MSTDDNCDEHLLKIMDVAVARLERDGELSPFRAIFDVHGQIEIEDIPYPALASSGDPLGEQMSAVRDEVLAKGASACAIVADVVRPKNVASAFEDAIMIRIEAQGVSALVFFPYHMPKGLIARLLLRAPVSRRQARFDGPFVFNTDPKIFCD